MGCWQQHILIFQAIGKSNGWSPATSALQLFAHLDGEALNVALLMPVKERERWEDLSKGLSEYYNSPGRLAVVRRRFESASRCPEVDPATFATELGILAIRGFEDMGKRARDLMIRNKFIAAQQSGELRRHLDGVSSDASIQDIVDSCRVWESHTGVADSWRGGSDPKFSRIIYQVAENTQSPVVQAESETLYDVRRQLLPTPAVSSPRMISSNCELLIQRILGVVRLGQSVIQERSRVTDLKMRSQNMLPVGSVTEVDVPTLAPTPEGKLNGRYRASWTHVAGRNNTPGKEGWSGRDGQPPGSLEIVVRLTPEGEGEFREDASRLGGEPVGRGCGSRWTPDPQVFPPWGQLHNGLRTALTLIAGGHWRKAGK